VNEHLHLCSAAGAANVGDKLLILVMSALAGGDCIDDAGATRDLKYGMGVNHLPSRTTSPAGRPD